MYIQKMSSESSVEDKMVNSSGDLVEMYILQTNFNEDDEELPGKVTLEDIERSLDTHKDVNTATVGFTHTILGAAINNTMIDLFDLIMKFNPDINLVFSIPWDYDYEDISPLSLAEIRKCDYIIEHLVKLGATRYTTISN